MKVRPAEPADAEAVADVQALATADLRRVYAPTEASRLRAAARAATLQRLVAEIDGKVAGTVRYRVEGRRLSIVGLMVHPDCRRRGVARALVDALAAIAQASGATHLSLYTINQTGNVPIFRKLGFAVAEQQTASSVASPDGRPLTESRMERPTTRSDERATGDSS